MYYCSSCEKCFSNFRQLQTHWSKHECIPPGEAENQPLRRPVDMLNNVWLNDNPFCDNDDSNHLDDSHDNDSESDDRSNNSVITIDSDNSVPHENQARSNSELQAELLHNIVVILEKVAEHILPQQASTPLPTHPLPAHPTPAPAPIATPPPCAPPSPKWQTVRKGPAPPKRYNINNTLEQTNRFSALANCDNGPNSLPPPCETQYRKAPTTRQTASPPKQNRPQVVINHKPEGVANWAKTSPGNSSYANTVKHGRNVIIYSDSICNRMSKWELNKKAADAAITCQINKKSFVGATSEDIHTYHMIPTLTNNTPDEVIIHAGINDVKQLAGKDGSMSSEVIDIITNNVIRCGKVAKYHGVNSVCISALLPTRGLRYQQTIAHINYRIERVCKREGFNFITNANVKFTESNPVDEGLYYKDGLHLNVGGRQVLMDNFISYLKMQ